MFSPRKESLREAVADMCHHQQGSHGWSAFHECLGVVAASRHPAGLDRLLASLWRSRPHISDAHTITLLGIAVRHHLRRLGSPTEVFDPEQPLAHRASALAHLLETQGHAISRHMESHSNSYTGARRFLLPQLVIGAFAESRGMRGVRLLDLGTSIGLLPRQLNNEVIFRRFAPDLRWHPAAPPYRPIPLDFVCGVDRPPLPTLEWVRTCHGPSDYYEQRLAEVLWSLEQSSLKQSSREQSSPERPGNAADEVRLLPLDLLDSPRLAGFLTEHRINVVTCNFVLYQYGSGTREELVRTVMRALGTPGLLLVMEPSHALARKGCTVHAYRDGSTEPLHVADVSDAHFMGDVTVGPGMSVLTRSEAHR
ncbi:hypothetical protein ABZ678_11695 [Streptomyces hirsutus]|uniref:hypothetical protein n=1 Tax=Streptomyces hirsutus TaxID=35620 RepID=UPI0033CBE246